jgi:hypothetical protein
MRDVRLALPIGLGFVALAAVGCGDGNDQRSATTAETVAMDNTTTETSSRGLPKLIGTVGSTDDPDAHEISLTTEDGAEVTTTLPPDEYMLEINDLSTIHNFHLGARRTGVDVATDRHAPGRGGVHLRLRRAPDHDERDLQHPRPDTDAKLERPLTVTSRGRLLRFFMSRLRRHDEYEDD